jgi:hypothetical protein
MRQPRVIPALRRNLVRHGAGGRFDTDDGPGAKGMSYSIAWWEERLPP